MSRATARQSRRACPRRLRDRAHHGRPRRGRQGRAAYPRPAGRRWVRPCRWSATSTTTATRCSAENPACAEALDKYRINPGNVGFKAKRDRQFSEIVELALKYGKPVRIGVNWGSLDQELLTRLMDENAASPAPKDARAVMHEAIVQSGLLSAERAAGAGDGAGEDRHLGQGQRRAGPRQRLHDAGRPLPLRPAPGAHRGGHGLQGHRRLHRRHGHSAAAGHRRHHPRVAHARARRRSHPGGAGGAGDPADHGLAVVRADRGGLPGLRAHHVDRVPGAGERHPELMCARACRSGATDIRAWRASTSR